MYRKTWMEVDLDAIEENVRTIKKICGKKFIAVMKADAYGCGDREVSRACLEAGADMLAVSSLDEAVVLRNEGCQAPILILGDVDPEDISILKKYDIAATAFSMHWVKQAVEKDCNGLKVHLKVDTGMNRIGFKDKNELKKALELLLEHGVKAEGIFTHFCCSDNKDMTRTKQQYALFADAVQYLNFPFEWIHCDNSDATIFFKDPISNACRVGISLYGMSPWKEDLRPALSLYSQLFMIKKIEKGETVGYGATYTAEKEETIGTIPIGYADGFIRANQGRNVYINGEYCPVVGRVCMDQCMVRLEKPHEEGEFVEIFGPHINLEKMAAELGTISYEVICLISPRVTRVYRKNGTIVSENNQRIEGSRTA